MHIVPTLGTTKFVPAVPASIPVCTRTSLRCPGQARECTKTNSIIIAAEARAMGRAKAQAVTNVKKNGAMANAQAIAAKAKAAAAKQKIREKRLILMKTSCLY